MDEKLCGTIVTPRWLQENIAKHLKVQAKPTLEKCSVKAIGQNVGFLSDIFAAHLTWSGEGSERMPEKVVVKVPGFNNADTIFYDTLKHDPEALKMPGMFFDRKAPEDYGWLYSMHDTETLTMFKLNDCAAHLRIPKLFGGQKGDFKNDVQPILVMQDFSETTAMQDFVQGASIEQILSLVDAIAEVHAESLKWDPAWAAEFIDEEKMKGVEQFVGMMKVMTMQLKRIEPALTELVDRILPHFTSERMMQTMQECMALDVPMMLAHGDLWLTNILWKKNTDGSAGNECAAIIDWQTAQAGAGVADLTRFLWSSVDGDLRRANHSRILDHYYASLTKHFGKELPFDRKLIDTLYDKSMAPVMMFTVFGFPMWANIKSIVGEEGDPKRHEKQAILMKRAKYVMEDYLAVHDK